MNSTKIVIDAPKRTLHGWIGATMVRIRELYWVPRLRRLTRKVIIMQRVLWGKTPTQGKLSTDRNEGSEPFGVV